MNPSGTDRPRLAPGVRLRWEGSDGEYLLLSSESELRLNETAALVLALCDGVRTVDELVGELGTRFPGEPEGRVKREALDLLANLTSRGLLSVEATPNQGQHGQPGV
jgi:pyrroloquinoline quinone biosynthesis protein D